MSKTTSGTTTQFLYDRLNPVQELNGSNGLVANLLTGLRIDEYFTRTDSSGSVSSFLADALGTTVGLVGSAQTIATSYTYQPFGATTVGGSANGNSYEFTGRENDGTGLYFYRARYYGPSFQRFIAQDPIGFAGEGPNLYAYVKNRPLSFVDPLGKDVGVIGVAGALEKGGSLLGIDFGPTWGGSAGLGIAISFPNPFFGNPNSPWGVRFFRSRGQCLTFNGFDASLQPLLSWSSGSNADNVLGTSEVGESTWGAITSYTPLGESGFGLGGYGVGLGWGQGTESVTVSPLLQ